jgi:hypothetical protein
MKPRIPTREEKIELLEYLLKYDYKNEKNERENIEGFVESAAIAVFDNYITSSPGYSGKLMVVVYEGAPEMTETYTWIKENESNITKLYRNVAVNTSNYSKSTSCALKSFIRREHSVILTSHR